MKTSKTRMSKTRSKTSSKTKGLGNQPRSNSTSAVGTYIGKSDKPLTRRQVYRLENKAIKLERDALATKPQMIKAVGQAFAMNVAPTASSYAASAGVTKGLSQQTNDLINGGMKQSGTANEEEMEEASGILPGGFSPN